MPHPDAIGYLKELATEVGAAWFDMASDIVSVDGAADEETLSTITAICLRRASYLRPMGALSAAPSPAAVAAHEFLARLHGFANFKRLEPTLEVSFTKQVTLIFGANGSGKSSVCEAFRILSSREVPARPLKNMLTGAAAPLSGFSYTLRTRPTPDTWSLTLGFGSLSGAIKYFDTTIAARNIKVAVEPGRIVELAPFRLHIFVQLTSIANSVRRKVQEVAAENASAITTSVEKIRAAFANFPSTSLSIVAARDLGSLDGVIAEAAKYDEAAAAKLIENTAALAELVKASSVDGLKLLRAEALELKTLLSSFEALVNSASELMASNVAGKSAALAEKLGAQATLAKVVVPDGQSVEKILALAKAAAETCSLEMPEGQPCPLCRQALDDGAIALFKGYHELIAGVLEKEISALKADLVKTRAKHRELSQIAVEDWSAPTVEPALLDQVKTLATLAKAGLDADGKIEEALPTALADAIALIKTASGTLAAKNQALATAEKGQEDLKKKADSLREETDKLKYLEALTNNLDLLQIAKRQGKRSEALSGLLATFPAILKRITDASKKAHTELVEPGFKAKLNSEYLSLTEQNMEDFGVALARRGSDSTVTLSPHIGGSEIDGVLSDGELRVHALALFFAELESCGHPIVIFDDPISSFDYNNIGNYCNRIRDFALKYRDRQIIILTHNWEFFAQVQKVLNTAGLDSRLSVQVLENCSTARQYSEKPDELKSAIDTVLNEPGEPSREKKEILAGNMRRLVEAVVNFNVFAGERSQYKQRSQSVSEFQKYTKLVPLLPTEATTLRDLYGKLSITEHDDIRNCYINTNKAVFANRYAQIIAVEAAVISRKTP